MMPVTTLPAARPEPARPDSPAVASWPALGTVATVAVPDPAWLPAARDLLTAEIAALDAACSTFRDDSELTAVNAAFRRDGGPVRVSPLLAEAIAAAMLAARQTGGDVDPVAGPGIRRAAASTTAGHADAAGPAAGAGTGTASAVWPVLPAGGPARLAVTTSAGWRELRLDAGRGLLSLPAGCWLDLGGTAKAWAADRAAAMIAARLGCGVLVSLGGDVAACGEAPRGGWRIRVQDNGPRLAGQPASPAAVVSIRGGGLATAGAGATRWRHGGDVLVHLLSPPRGTLAPARWRLASVTAANCLQARAASIAAILRGDDAASWLAGLGLPARLVDAAGQVRTIAAWPADRTGPPAPPATPAAGPAGAATGLGLSAPAPAGTGLNRKAKLR